MTIIEMGEHRTACLVLHVDPLLAGGVLPVGRYAFHA